MMKFYLLFGILFLTVTAIAQCPEAIARQIISMKEFDEGLFDHLPPNFRRSKLVGIGEDTHGTSEFTTLVEYLMVNLSERNSDVALFIETMEGEGAILNAYVQGQRHDYLNIIRNINSSWRYRTEEFRSLIEQIKWINTQTGKNITVYGTEVQYVKVSRDLVNAYLDKVDSKALLTGFERHIWQSSASDTAIQNLQAISDIEREFTDNRSSFVNQSSQSEYDEAFKKLRNLKNFVAITLQDFEATKHDLRDLYMAYNILDRMVTTNHDKYVYWAHNSHVGRDQLNGTADVAGRELAKRLKDDYFAIKTDFGTGEFLAFPHNADEVGWEMGPVSYGPLLPNTISACISAHLEVDHTIAVLDIRGAMEESGELEKMMTTPLIEMSGAGSQARRQPTAQITLFPIFDALIYLRKSSPIHFLHKNDR